MKILGIVPARGGSKRLPRKNIADLGGKPLLAWTIEQAKKAEVFHGFKVSTEDEEIGNIANQLWPDSWYKRDPKLALDTTPSLDVVRDVFENYPSDIVVLLQPTSPFRTAEDIWGAIELLIRTNGDSVISVTDAPEDMAFEIGFAKRLRNVPSVVVPNGAVYAITGGALSRGLSWTSGVVYGFKMGKSKSIDIDNDVDLQLANYMVSKGLHC